MEVIFVSLLVIVLLGLLINFIKELIDPDLDSVYLPSEIESIEYKNEQEEEYEKIKKTN